MTAEQCDKSANHMYEYNLNGRGKWYPCHILDTDYQMKGHIYIFTRNGTCMFEHIENVRKMSIDDYIKQRESFLGDPYFTEIGFHDDIEEDLKLFMKSDDIAVNKSIT